MLATFAMFGATPATADQLIDKVNGITLDDNGKPRFFGALLIADDGRVKQLLGPKDKRPKKLNIYYDAGGKTMLPGFAAPDCDLVALGLAPALLDLSATKTHEEVLAATGDFAARNPTRRWIIGHGWHATALGAELPDAAMLDRAVPDRPVWLVDDSGDIGWANSLALDAAGLKTVLPGFPRGMLAGTALDRMKQALPLPRPAELDRAIRDGQEMLIAKGVTSVHLPGTDIATWQALRRAGDEARLRTRVVVYAASIADMVLIAGQQPTPWLYDNRLRGVGLSHRLDGGIANGPLRIGGAELRNSMSRAAMDGFQSLIVAHGAGAVEEAVLAIEELGFTYNGDRRWRINGIASAAPADVAMAGRLDIWVTLGVAPGAPRRSLAAAGANVSLAGRCGPAVPDPLKLFTSATALKTENPEPLSREQALAAITLNPARAARAEAVFGTLLPGQMADFVLLEGDPLLGSPAALASAQIAETWIGGVRYFVRNANDGTAAPRGR